ncbi:MAG: hypothetical protein JWM42_1783 [Burkholderia sp.]|jgi:hypothetical protein|nr:hypothetical protein [Burkholderia sp.]
MFKTGTLVGAGRWPNQLEHPNHWDKPLAGHVIDFCDARAWANTIYFPSDNPHPGEVMGMALKLKEQGLLEGLTPVYWDFVTHQRVTWEKTSSLRLYEEDVSLWRACKELRLDELKHPRRRRRRDIGEFLPDNMQHLALQKLPPVQYRH